MAFRASTTVSAAANTRTIDKPAGVVDGDTLVLVVSGEGTIGTATIATPAGFSPIAAEVGSGNFRSRAFHRIANSEPASYTIEHAGGGTLKIAGVLLAYDETMTVDVGAGSNNAASTSVLHASVTAAGAGTLIAVGAARQTSGTWTMASGMTSRATLSTTAGSMGAADQAITAAGATGTRTHTMTNSRENHGHTIMLAAAAQAESGGSDAPVTLEVAATGGGASSVSSGGSAADIEIVVDATGGGEPDLPIPTATTWRGRIGLVIEAGRRGVAVGEGVWADSETVDPSLWADSETVDPPTWSGLEPEWESLDGCHVLEAFITRGRFAGTDRFNTGTARLLLTFPLAAGAWSFRPTAPVGLGDDLRLRAGVDGGGFIPMFRGTVRRLSDRWTPGSDRLELEVELVDRFGDLAAVDPPPVEVAVGAGELTSDRIGRLMVEAEIDPYYLDLAVGVATVAGTTFSRNLLDEAQATAEGESGPLYVARDGRITFRGRDWLTASPRSAVTRLVWSNDPESSHMTYVTAFQTGLSTELLANQVTRARAGGSPITVRDEPSIIVYGLRTNRRLDLIVDNDTDVTFAAEAFLAERSTRINQVGPLSAVLLPYLSSAMLSQLVDIELLDRHEIRWTDGTAAGELVEVMHVQSVAHQISNDRWTVTVGVWAYTEGI